MNDRVIRGTLVTRSALHLGSGSGGRTTDLGVIRDASGRPYIPGTQIAGRLREIATRVAPAVGLGPPCAVLIGEGVEGGVCDCPVCRTFGSRRTGADSEDDEDGTPAARASSVWCFDAVPSDGGWPATVIRDGAGINRRTGSSASAARAKYDLELIPRGTRFDLRIELELGASDEAERVLALAVSEWQQGRGRLGRGAARGAGAFELEDLRFQQAGLGTPEGLVGFLKDGEVQDPEPGDTWVEEHLAYLLAEAPAAPRSPHTPRGSVTHYLHLELELRFEGPMLVRDPGVGLVHGLDAAPLHSGPDWTDPVLPGSALRGVLRTQIGRIARTLGTRAASNARELAAGCPACHIFERKPDHALRACGVAGADQEAGDQDDELCLTCQLFGNTGQGSRLWIEDAYLVPDAVAEYKLRDFVAIDRFTGGALDGAKFDALPLLSPRFEVRALLWNAAPWELTALAFALRDVDDGLVTIGAHGSKGFGTAAVPAIELELGHLPGCEPKIEADFSWERNGRSGVFQTTRWKGAPGDLVRAAREAGWMASFQELCERGDRRRAPAHHGWEDSYFGAFDGIYGAVISQPGAKNSQEESREHE